jgi:hypothetical protein
MAPISFPTPVVIPNVVPTLGNTVPIYGGQAIENSTELLMYAALLEENRLAGDAINFGNVILPTIEINKVPTQSGLLFWRINAYVQMNPDWAAYPSGKKLWKQVVDRLENNPASTSFNL